MRLERIRKGQKPCTCSRDTIEAKVSNPVAFVCRRTQQVLTGLGLNLGRQTLLGRGAGGAIDAGIGKEGVSESRLNIRPHEASVDVVFVKSWPNA